MSDFNENRDRRPRILRSRPPVVASTPSVFQVARTTKEVALSIGYENIFLEQLIVEPSTIANIAFDNCIPLSSGSLHTKQTAVARRSRETPISARSREVVQRQGASDIQLFFVLCGDSLNKDRLAVKQLTKEDLARCGDVAVYPLATVRYTSPSFSDGDDSCFHHELFHASPLSQQAVECAQAADGLLQRIVDQQRIDGSEEGDSQNFTLYTFRVASTLYREALECAAGRVLNAQLEIQSTGVAQRRVAAQAIIDEIDRLRWKIEEVHKHQLRFVSRWQDKADNERMYMTNGEAHMLKNLLRDAFDLAISQERKYAEGVQEIISQLEKSLYGLLRRKRMSPSAADLWAFRLFDPELTGIISTPYVRTILASVPQIDTGAEITEELILMGKVSSAQPFQPSTIHYDLPK